MLAAAAIAPLPPFYHHYPGERARERETWWQGSETETEREESREYVAWIEESFIFAARYCYFLPESLLQTLCAGITTKADAVAVCRRHATPDQAALYV